MRDARQSFWLEPPFGGNVRFRVTYYCEVSRIDSDNLLKPIQGALQGIVYLNDRQCVESESRLRDINEPGAVRYISAWLALALSNGRPFVHIEVWDKPDRERVL